MVFLCNLRYVSKKIDMKPATLRIVEKHSIRLEEIYVPGEHWVTQVIVNMGDEYKLNKPELIEYFPSTPITPGNRLMTVWPGPDGRCSDMTHRQAVRITQKMEVRIKGKVRRPRLGTFIELLAYVNHHNGQTPNEIIEALGDDCNHTASYDRRYQQKRIGICSKHNNSWSGEICGFLLVFD